ncbi:MAG: HNH endonuclease [Coleofasciculus chthonoplastes F3-SA18-01]|uniref:HNH endonuclease n=1 Tax=Coleofasciculus chthonoplastes TaxID=64178 RepID=UPI0032F9D484
MAATKPTTVSEIVFEQRDSEIFKIPDTRTRLDTLQKYFFPRLEVLLRHTLDVIQTVYDVNPYERMTFVYAPSHRKTARQNFDHGQVHIGLSGKRRTDRTLTIKRRDGKPFFLHPTYLTYNVDLQGGMFVQLLPFRQGVDPQFVSAVADLIRDNLDTLSPIFALTHISHSSAEQFVHIKNAFTDEEVGYDGIRLLSPLHYFPLNINRGLVNLILAFIALYPLLDSLFCIAEGELPKLSQMLKNFKNWYLSDEEEYEEKLDSNDESSDFTDLPELESYSFVRAGLWWSVLARDKWKCCSCGRSAKDGITLHVDHIKPRSLGGTDDIKNLQTLCLKCNIGKSNKDSTDLR